VKFYFLEHTLGSGNAAQTFPVCAAGDTRSHVYQSTSVGKHGGRCVTACFLQAPCYTLGPTGRHPSRAHQRARPGCSWTSVTPIQSRSSQITQVSKTFVDSNGRESDRSENLAPDCKAGAVGYALGRSAPDRPDG